MSSLSSNSPNRKLTKKLTSEKTVMLCCTLQYQSKGFWPSLMQKWLIMKKEETREKRQRKGCISSEKWKTVIWMSDWLHWWDVEKQSEASLPPKSQEGFGNKLKWLLKTREESSDRYWDGLQEGFGLKVKTSKSHRAGFMSDQLLVLHCMSYDKNQTTKKPFFLPLSVKAKAFKLICVTKVTL